ncbi:MAG: Ig-like domain-containing protein [Nitrososphaerales archaeon]
MKLRKSIVNPSENVQVTATLTSSVGGLSGRRVLFQGSWGWSSEVVSSQSGLAQAVFTAPLEGGSYTVSASFSGDDIYEGCAQTVAIYVKSNRVATQIQLAVKELATQLSVVSVDKPTKLDVSGILQTTGGLGLSNKQITLSTDWGVELTLYTSSEGRFSAKISTPTVAGSYLVKAAFSGDSIYAPSSSTAKLVVNVASDQQPIGFGFRLQPIFIVPGVPNRFSCFCCKEGDGVDAFYY